MEGVEVTGPCPRCGASNPGGRLVMCPGCLLEPELTPEALSDTYEILEKVGQGGMGTVYRGRHRRLQRAVALKFLDEPVGASSDFHERLEVEGSAMARLVHPHIVAVHDLGREAGHSYIVMEYVDGAPLSQKIPMSLPRALQVADQVCDALAYAHSQGVVHCDVKPENILVDLQGHVKVSDFGVARLQGGGSLAGAVSRGLVMGTRAYMAPEAMAGGPPDPRMDVYSLGVVLHEMVMGFRPEPGSQPEGTLAPVLRRALARDPGERYASITEMRRALDRLADSAPLHAAAPDDLRLIRVAALGAALCSVVGMRGLEWGAKILGNVLSGAALPVPETLDGPAALVLAAGLSILVTSLLMGARWRRAAVARAPAGYDPLYAGHAGPWGLAALLILAVRASLDRLGGPGSPLQEAGAVVQGLGDLFQFGALFLTWAAVLDTHRVRQRVTRNGQVVTAIVLAVAPTIAEIALALHRPQP
jgi:eukaryotic-like serine/threonine-protein kinase